MEIKVKKYIVSYKNTFDSSDYHRVILTWKEILEGKSPFSSREPDSIEVINDDEYF